MALLDERRPGWTDRIDLGRLDISDLGDCVCGQPGEQIGHGFGALADNDGLTAEWRRQILRRRAYRVESHEGIDHIGAGPDGFAP